MCEGSFAECGAEVRDVAAQGCPDAEQDREGDADGDGEDADEEEVGRLRPVLEDVVDLVFLAIALSWAGNGGWGEGIGDHGQVEEVLVVWVGGAE